MAVEPAIAVIIPAYNEEVTIADVIADFARELPKAEIVVVDNNSSDRTAVHAQEAIARSGCRGRVIFEGRQGKGNAMRRAFGEVEADLYIMVDADRTYPAEQVHDLLAPVLRGEADMVMGDRHAAGVYAQQNRRPFHNLGNVLVRNLVNLLFNCRLNDIMTGYRVLTRKFARNFPVMTRGFEIETEMTVHALDKRFAVKEVPVRYVERPAGSESKLHTFRDGLRVLAIIGNLLRFYRPLQFFAVLAAACLTAGLIVGYFPVREYMTRPDHFITKVPSAILASGLVICSLLFFSVGLILDMIARNEKAAYELWLNNRPLPPRQ